MVAMATSHTLLRYCFIALTPTIFTYSFAKQDLTAKQAYCASFCFVLVLNFNAFYRLYFKITLFYTTPSGQIISCHVTDIKMLRFFVRHVRKMHFDNPQIAMRTGMCRLDLGGGGAMVVLFCKKLPQLYEIFLFIWKMNEPVMAIRGKAFHKVLYQSSCAYLYIGFST